MISSVHLLSHGRAFVTFHNTFGTLDMLFCPVIPFYGGRFSPCHRSFVVAHKT